LNEAELRIGIQKTPGVMPYFGIIQEAVRINKKDYWTEDKGMNV